MTEKEIKGIGHFAKDIPTWTTKILPPNNPWNSISFGGLGGADTLTVRSGGIPFLAWPAEPAVLADIAFGRVLVITLFNPGHLMKRLHERGYKIDIDEKYRLKKASQEVDGKVVELENYNYFFSLVQHSLMTEDAVMSMVDKTLEVAQDISRDRHPAKIEFITRIRRGSSRNARRQTSGPLAD